MKEEVMENVVGLLLIGLLVFYFLGGKKKFRYRPKTTSVPSEWQKSSPTTDDRLSALRSTSISIKKPINREAYKVLVRIEKILEADAPKARVLAEVGMGAFLTTTGQGDLLPEDKLAFSSFNAKRVDFLVIDGLGQPSFIVEYQGSGHHLGAAAERDMLKREAIRRARIELVEIFNHHSDAEVDALLRAAVQRNCKQVPTSRRPDVKSQAAISR